MAFLLITLTLVLLIGLSFWFKVPRASIPLLVIYFIFLIIRPKENILEENSLESSDLLKRESEMKQHIKLPKTIGKNLKPQPLTIKPQDQLETKKTKKTPLDNNERVINENDTNIPIENDERILIVKDIRICRGIKQRNPVGESDVFPNTIDSLYCYTRIQNSGNKTEVKHIWYYENQVMTQVRYNVKKSNIYRSWTKKTILSSQVGNWRVDIQDRYGTIIGSKAFIIESSQ